MFRKMIAGFALALAAVGAFAASTTVDTSGLTEAQVAEIRAIAAKKVAETAAQAAKPGSDVTPEKVTAGVTLAATWGTQAAAAAEGFAKALGIAAKELNITINDFLKSPAGMLTAALIIWKMAGAAILHAIYGFIVLAVGLTMLRVLYTRLFTKEYKEVQYERFFGAFKGTKMVRVPKTFADLKNDGEWLAFWVMLILGVIVMVFAGAFF
jgi:hypothetical protein